LPTAPNKKTARGKSKKKAESKAKVAKRVKPKAAPKRSEPRKVEPTISVQPPTRVTLPATERVRISVQNIRGDTAIGDLLVAFPRTREVLVRNGLRLEAEAAGDIYMTLDAFSAMNGLKMETLVHDIVEIAKEPPLQQPVPQVAAAPAV
jgi:hypothetical protein